MIVSYTLLPQKQVLKKISISKEFTLLKQSNIAVKILTANEKYLRDFPPYINDKSGTEDFLLFHLIKDGIDFTKYQKLSDIFNLLKNKLTTFLVNKIDGKTNYTHSR